MKQIIKTAGYCSDGCQWTYCDFLRTEKIEINRILVPHKNIPNHFEEQSIYEYHNYCDLFNVEMNIKKGSLKICNKVYGPHYQGDV